MTNLEKLKELVLDTFLLDASEFRYDLLRNDVETWDSLGVVSFAVGIEQTFGYHMTPEEAVGITGLPATISLLKSKGVSFDE